MQNTNDPVLDRIRQRSAKTRRSVRSRGIVKILALAFMATWGTWICNQISQLDAYGMGLAARHRVEAALPGVRTTLKAQLEEQAPVLAAQIVEYSLAFPSTVRARAEQRILENIDNFARMSEACMREQIVIDVVALRRDLDARYPDLGDEEKVRRLTDEAVRSMRAQVQSALLESMEPFERSVELTLYELQQLSDPTGLTKKERVQREILITTRELLARMQARGEIGIPLELRNISFSSPLADIR